MVDVIITCQSRCKILYSMIARLRVFANARPTGTQWPQKLHPGDQGKNSTSMYKKETKFSTGYNLYSIVFLNSTRSRTICSKRGLIAQFLMKFIDSQFKKTMLSADLTLSQYVAVQRTTTKMSKQ